MRRIGLVLALAAMMATMVASAGPAFAQEGCKDFGHFVRLGAKTQELGQAAKEAASLNDEVHAAKVFSCFS